jgi:glyoxylase-like metal-dependent hydrolase (beta-lactamase superfamily II)
MSKALHLIGCAALMAIMSSGSALAQEPPFATTKVQGTDNVYVFRYGGGQAMFVVTSAGVIATDPIGYGRPEVGTTYVAELRKVTNQPIRHVVYSHHHFDRATCLP